MMSCLPEIANPHRKPYPSDLSDGEWEVMQKLLPQPKRFEHPIEVDFREILNGIFYVLRSGCQWEMMPHDLPSIQRSMATSASGSAKEFGNKCMMRPVRN
ncbi:transposase [Leptolyngbya sp. PL-A3]|nr:MULTISPECIES: transposase [unclassified Leptolyngbya]MBD1914005.1 transposase [Leptolyngbya sp. FACHB-8]MBD2158069.1 transposase [Leptolyngbya sp. FACHB-16]